MKKENKKEKTEHESVMFCVSALPKAIYTLIENGEINCWNICLESEENIPQKGDLIDFVCKGIGENSVFETKPIKKVIPAMVGESLVCVCYWE
jgi:hypothetical protein